MDGALRNLLSVQMRLGLFDPVEDQSYSKVRHRTLTRVVCRTYAPHDPLGVAW
jgi:hypothetical protein